VWGKRKQRREEIQQFDRAVAEMHAQDEVKRQQQLQALEAEADKLKLQGVAPADATSRALANLARPHVMEKLSPAEAIRLEGSCLHDVAGGNFLPTCVVVTNQRALWCIPPNYEMVLDLDFLTVVNVATAEFERGNRALRLTYRPHDFPEGLRKHNPLGELDSTFLFAPRDGEERIRAALMVRSGVAFPDTEDERDRAFATRQFVAIQDEPVANLDLCPICCHEIVERTKHCAKCATNHHVFCDPGFQPVLSEDDATYAKLLDEREWLPLFAFEVPLQGRTTFWLIRPRGALGPMVIADATITVGAFS
jgi:hypothetical protein